MRDLENALGQFIFYHDVLAVQQPERTLFLAVRLGIYTKLFEDDEAGKLLLKNKRLRLLVFNDDTEEIVKWIS